ncbi:MAG: hypothetical protein ACK2U2_12865 [Anaerolineae bacterium]|jgi:hypothetical protein
MINYADAMVVDLSVFAIANLFNVLLTGIFLCRPWDLRRAEKVLGLATVALVVPLILAMLLNLAWGREWWTVVLPGIMVVHLLVELLLDYVLRVDFRGTALLWPYLLIFYLAQMGMIGYSFLVGKVFGAVTLATYFLCLLATWYSYARVGHGQRVQGGPDLG